MNTFYSLFIDTEWVLIDRRLVSPKCNSSPLRTNQRLLGIPDSRSRISDYDPCITIFYWLAPFYNIASVC